MKIETKKTYLFYLPNVFGLVVVDETSFLLPSSFLVLSFPPFVVEVCINCGGVDELLLFDGMGEEVFVADVAAAVLIGAGTEELDDDAEEEFEDPPRTAAEEGACLGALFGGMAVPLSLFPFLLPLQQFLNSKNIFRGMICKHAKDLS